MKRRFLKAYTLIELSVVLAIISIFILLFMPRAIMLIKGKDIKQVAKNIAKLHEIVYYKSIFKKKSFILLIDLDKQRLTPMHYGENGRLEEYLDLDVKVLKLRGVKIQDVYVGGEKWEDRKIALVYHPMGTNFDVIIHIKRRNEEYSVILYRFFGKYEIKKGYITKILEDVYQGELPISEG